MEWQTTFLHFWGYGESKKLLQINHFEQGGQKVCALSKYPQFASKMFNAH